MPLIREHSRTISLLRAFILTRNQLWLCICPPPQFYPEVGNRLGTMPTVHRYQVPGEMPLVAPMRFLATLELLKGTTVFFFPFSNLLICNSGESALRFYYRLGPLESEMMDKEQKCRVLQEPR